MITITLNQILAKHPCADGWARILHARGKITEQQMQEVVDGGCVPNSYSKLADDEAFPLALALESNGLNDVLWSLRCLPDDHRLWLKYAVWCARQVQHLMRDKRSINALDVAWRHSDGLATDEELSAARRSAAAAYAAADAAAYADAAASPVAVLALIAENEQLYVSVGYEEARFRLELSESERLRAENKALRKDAGQGSEALVAARKALMAARPRTAAHMELMTSALYAIDAAMSQGEQA